MTILSKNNQDGRSMVEMLGVLAIIGVLSIGGISGYSKAMAKYKLTKAQDQLTMLLMNIRTAYATSPSYAGLTASSAASYKLAPSEMISGNQLYGAFGGEVELKTLGTGSTYFSITLKALGKEACRSLASSDWGADGLVGVWVNSAGAATCSGGGSGGKYCVANLPMILSSANAECKNETNDITWVYY